MRKQPFTQQMLWVCSLTAVVFAFAGCKGAESTGSSGMVEMPSTGGGSSPGIVNDEAGFQVTVEPQSGVTTYIHKFGASNFSQPCKIMPGSSPTDLKCIVHAKEEDLWYWGLKLTVNVPRQLCEYLVQRPYWYYNLRGGYGVSQNINVAYNKATNTLTCSASGLTTSASGGVCFVATSESAAGEVQVSADGAVSCAYDYSASGGPNCCEGKYKVILTTTTATETTTQTLSGDYGGQVSNCADGPAAKNSQWPHDKAGFPIGKVNNILSSGYNETLEIPSGSSEGRTYAVSIANFYDWTTYLASNTLSTKPMPVLGGTLVTQTPSYMSYGTDLSGSAVRTPFDAYEYRCENAAGEILQRIRVYIKDWDTSSAFDTYMNTAGASGSPRTTNPLTDYEGSACEVGSSIGVGRCDDFLDWDDLRGISTSLFPSEF